MAPLPKMRRQNENTDTAAYGAGGFSSILPKVQIHLCDPVQRRENDRDQHARRLDAVQTAEPVCTASVFWSEVIAGGAL